jgi:uncharacterized protein YjbI with pentapeptide repeats
MEELPDWWRGQLPPPVYDGPRPAFGGPLFSLDLAEAPVVEASGLHGVTFFDSRARGLDLELTDVHLSARWSEFDGCTFRQRVRPVLNARGFAAQGSFGTRPSIYRSCTFERVRFKTAGGFSMGQARFENCVFRNCRWEGHFAHSADLVGCTFVGKMNGCVWFGEERHPWQRRNEVRGNDFTGTVFTDNVGWRFNFPVADQIWPEGFQPTVRAYDN